MENSQFLQPPSDIEFSTASRAKSDYHSLSTFKLPIASARKYSTQFADLYFARLALLKHHLEKVVEDLWKDFELGGEKATRVERVLDVRQGELCWVVGTVFMDMILKPNILDDLAKEAYIIAPPSRETYRQEDGTTDKIVLEDESGRLPLTGKFLNQYILCTGCIVGVLGTETKDGEFEVIDLKPADLPAQPVRWALQNKLLAAQGQKPERSKKASGKIAIVSGLEMDGQSSDSLELDLLAEYLLGESGDGGGVNEISRLIVAGNSFGQMAPIPTREELMKKSAKKYGADPVIWNASPAEQVDSYLANLLPSLPITLMPGGKDPTSVSVPQPALHAAMFPYSRKFSKHPADKSNEASWFDSVTNPWDGEVDGWRVLATGGQPVNDMFKYLTHANRLQMMESFLRWRNVAPTAPDTLWTYPYQEDDPFVLRECPHLFIAGDQPRFETTTITGPNDQTVRLVAVPSFRHSGVLVLVDSETLEVETVEFKVYKDHKDPQQNGTAAA